MKIQSTFVIYLLFYGTQKETFLKILLVALTTSSKILSYFLKICYIMIICN